MSGKKQEGPLRVEGDLIYTSHVVGAEGALDRLIEVSGLGAFIGPSGAGKTYVMSRLVSNLDRVRVVWIEPVSDPTQRQLALQIADELAGPVKLRTRYQLFGFLIERLREYATTSRILLVVDEAQRLGRKCIEDLRYLHDQVGEGFALALLGGRKCWDVIEGDLMLRSRIRRRTNFGYLKNKDAISVARIYHQIYSGVSEKILIEINVACRGRFRTWFHFTDEAAALCEIQGKKRITREVTRDTLLLMNGKAESWIQDTDETEESS